MHIRSAMLSLATAALITSFVLVSGAAQVPDSGEVQAQAAAMTLTSEDLPTGYILAGETFLPLPDAATLPGGTAHYVSEYTNTDTGQVIRSYVYLFEDDAQATAAFTILEGDEAESLTDAAADVGSGEAEITTGTYEAADGSMVGTADVTFVRGNAVIGVAVDNPDGSVPDGQLATDLATRADERAQQVAGDESDVDLALPALIVPITNDATVLQAGYLTPAESESVYGTQGSALASLIGTYVQTNAYGDSGTAPRVTIGVSTFASADESASVVEQSDSIFQPLTDQERLDATVEGADTAVAYRYTSSDGAAGSLNSYRLIFSVGDTVTVVDVQGAQDSATAEAAANSIAGPQLTCQTGGECVKPTAENVIP